jgi:ABC-type uncharacterized transport system involved in gliding motility auxiliary subunit
VGLLRAYKPEGKSLMLAARVTGDAKTAYPDGVPKPVPAADDKPKDDAAKADAPKPDAPKADAPKEEKAAEPAAPAKPQKTAGRVNAIIIADSDILADQFWVDIRDFLGQQMAIPNAGNASFVVNALDNLSGSEALISLRGRGTDDRSFTLVADIRRDAERRYREKEQTLTAKLKEVQEQLSKLESGGDGTSAILSESDRQAIDKFRGDMLSIRRELREVQRALREDIDSLDRWLRFANIGLVPLLIVAGGAGWAVLRRRRAAASRAASNSASNGASKSGDQGETS